MIAKNDPNLQQASNDLYVINADEIMRQQVLIAQLQAQLAEKERK